MRITSKGQVTIPLHIREALGLHANSEVEFTLDGDAVRIVKREPGARSRGRALVEHMRGRGNGRLSTDEILRLTRG